VDHVGAIIGGDHEGGIIKQEHGGGLMEEETWRGKYGGRNMGEETLRMNHEAVITGGESLGGGSWRRIIKQQL